MTAGAGADEPASANLAAVLGSRAVEQGWENAPAFLVGDQLHHHGEVHERAARTASLLAQVGVRPGDRVMIVAPDGMSFVCAFLGAVRLGAVAVPVNPRLTADDHRLLLGDCGAQAVVSGPDLAERFGSGPAVLDAERLWVDSEALPPRPPAPVGPCAPAYAQYTSGTTGLPKAALHRHRDPLVYFEAFAAPALAIQPGDVVLSVSKMYFAYGLGNSLFFPLLSGCSAVLVPGAPRPEEVAELVRSHQVSILFSVPTFYAHLVNLRHRELFASVRVAVSAGETLIPALAERARRFLGCPILDGLGSTEVGQTFLSNTLNAQRDGTVGRVLPPYSIAVRDEGGRDLPPGEVGTLWVRGPTVMIEYLGRPEATAAVKSGEWLCTGDRVVCDVEGFVHHRGRVDDLEMVGGISVGPLEIEQLLGTHSGVTEVAVVGVRDPQGASRLEAFVVPAPGRRDHERLGAELVEMARSRLAPYKVPKAVHFVEGLPRTPTGKLRRFVLRAGPGSW